MDVYGIDGKVARSIELPRVFSESFRKELVLRAILAEQSLRYQPKGRNLMAGLRTTATYVGNYKSYRTGRHMGIAIRPREKLGGGAMGYVRRIPSSVKGRRAHAQKVEFIKGWIGKSVKVTDVLGAGDYIDVKSISTGKGWAGVVKRFWSI